MAEIRCICISDLHLGEEESLLTAAGEGGGADCLSVAPVMTSLAHCLGTLVPDGGRRPDLVLCGDILELALATTDQAAMVFERLMELLSPPGGGLFERVVFIPGNHDHHFWELARETQYARGVLRKGRGRLLPVPWHTTQAFGRGTTSYFLDRLIVSSSSVSDVDIDVYYPNYGIFDEGRSRCVTFHHGHFVEPVYTLMSRLRTMLEPGRGLPEDVDGLEAENWAWIDFFWSMMGRSGAVGETVETIHDLMHFPDLLRGMLHDFAGRLASTGGWRGAGDIVERKVLERVMDLLTGGITGLEKMAEGGPLTGSAEEGLISYLSGPLKRQLIAELGGVPEEMTFVFGHTHKPFSKRIGIKGFNSSPDVLNTGCWVVESAAMSGTRGGAIVVVDEDLNAALIKVWDEMNNAGPPVVETGGDIAGSAARLAEDLRNRIGESSALWEALASAVASESAIRRKNLAAKMRGEKP